MQFVPWRRVADWECLTCGICCKLYSVVIDFPEWLGIANTYGIEKTASGVDKLYINRRNDGSCVFLCSFANAHFCGLQQMKPRACQIWPFKVLDSPKYGWSREAAFDFGKMLRVYIYVDSMCNGVRYGVPSFTFVNQTLREFVEIAVGLRKVQMKTTARPSLQHRTFRWPGF
jgi:Fe-S-cluster containining protein